MRRLETAAVAFALALLLVGLSVRLLTIPAFTSVVARAVDSPTRSGLAPETALDLADQVRAYVVGANTGPLPDRVDGREGFTPDAVAHLDDVRTVLIGAARATWLLVVGVAGWVAWCIRAGRQEIFAQGVRTGGWTAIVLVPLAALAALGDFDAFFAAFHGLFFQAGTWQFSSSDLLIQLFPEPFWMTGGAAWAALVFFGGVVLLGVSRLLVAERQGHSGHQQGKTSA